MKGSDIIVEILYNLGVKDIFGYPGGYVLDIYESLRKFGKINHYLTCSEAGAVFAADGYARASKKVGVTLATSGPGATNLVTGIATANMDSIPLLAITGNVPTKNLGTDSFQEVDIFGVTMPVTKYNHMVKDKNKLIEELINAYTTANALRSGAVLIDIPQDIQKAEINITSENLRCICNNYQSKTDFTPDIKAVNDAIQLINNSKKICILCGGGASNATLELEKLAELLNSPVCTSLMGVNLFNSKKINYLGLSGSFGNPTSNFALSSADTIISLGARFGDRLTKLQNLNKSQIIQIDIDIAEHDKNINSVCFIKGDVASVLNAMLPQLTKKDDSFLTTLLNYKQKHGQGDNLRSTRNVLNYLSEFVGEDAFVATDVGEHQMNVVKNFCFGRNFFTSGGFGTMGWGLGALIGATIAKMPQKSLLITGDGSFNMSLNELATVVKLNLPILIIIFNNHSLGMCKTLQLKDYNFTYQTDTPNINYQLLANGFGAKSAKANNLASLKSVLKNYTFNSTFVVELNLN